MKAYEVFLVQTQKITNVLHIIVLCIIPYFWFSDCKGTMALLFKRIDWSHMKDAPKPTDYPQSLMVLLIILGLPAYYLHRRWRLAQNEEKFYTLLDEWELTDSKDLHILKEKLSKVINRIIERRRILNALRKKGGIPKEEDLEGNSPNPNTV